MQVDSRTGEGKHLLMVGGIHGNEPSGVQAMIQMHQKLVSGEIVLKSGKISFLLGNPEAYKQEVRYIDEDLNRAFSGERRDSVEYQRVLEIRNFIQSQTDIHFLMDFHSVSTGDFQILVYNIGHPENMDLALKLSSIPTRFAYHPDHIRAPMIEEVSQYDISSIAIECGNHSSPEAIDIASQHMNNAMVYFGMCDGTITKLEDGEKVKRYKSFQVVEPRDNFKYTLEGITTGTWISEGQVFAEDSAGPHVAPKDCFIMMPTKEVRDSDTDAGWLCDLECVEV